MSFNICHSLQYVCNTLKSNITTLTCIQTHKHFHKPPTQIYHEHHHHYKHVLPQNQILKSHLDFRFLLLFLVSRSIILSATRSSILSSWVITDCSNRLVTRSSIGLWRDWGKCDNNSNDKNKYKKWIHEWLQWWVNNEKSSDY